MFGKLTDKFANVQNLGTGLVEFLESTTGEDELKRHQEGAPPPDGTSQTDADCVADDETVPSAPADAAPDPSAGSAEDEGLPAEAAAGAAAQVEAAGGGPDAAEDGDVLDNGHPRPEGASPAPAVGDGAAEAPEEALEAEGPVAEEGGWGGQAAEEGEWGATPDWLGHEEGVAAGAEEAADVAAYDAGGEWQAVEVQEAAFGGAAEGAGEGGQEPRRAQEQLRQREEEWGALEAELRAQIEGAVAREQEAHRQCGALRQQLQSQADGGKAGAEHAKTVSDLEQKLQASAKREAQQRLEMDTAQEAFQSLKEEFQKTQQKEERQLSLVRKDRDELRKKVKDLEKRLEKQAHEGSDGVSEALKEEGEKLSREVGVKNEKIKELMRAKKDLEAQVQELSDGLAHLQEKERQWAEMKVQYEQLQDMSRGQTQQSERAGRDLRDAQKQIASLNASLEAASSDREAHAAHVAEEFAAKEQRLLEELAAARHGVERIQREADARVTVLMRELEAAQQRTTQAERRIVEVTTGMPEALQPLQQQIETLEAQIAPLRAMLEERDGRVGSLQAALEQQQGRARAIEAESRQWMEREHGLQKGLRAAQAEAAAERDKAQALQEELAQAQASQRAAERELQQHKAQLSAALAKLQTAQQELVASQATVTRLNAQKSTAAAAAATAVAAAPPPKPADPPAAPAAADLPQPQWQTSLQQVSDAKAHLQRELKKLMVENADLKGKGAQFDALKRKYQDVNHRYNVLLELMGEKEEECLDLKARLAAVG